MLWNINGVLMGYDVHEAFGLQLSANASTSDEQFVLMTEGR